MRAVTHISWHFYFKCKWLKCAENVSVKRYYINNMLWVRVREAVRRRSNSQVAGAAVPCTSFL